MTNKTHLYLSVVIFLLAVVAAGLIGLYELSPWFVLPVAVIGSISGLAAVFSLTEDKD